MFHPADELGLASSPFPAQELNDPDHLDELEEFDDFDDPDEWAETSGDDPLLLPPDEQADERLSQILERLEGAIPEGIPTVWVRVFRAARESGVDDGEPERVEIDGDLSGLVGYVAPPDCSAVAIFGAGRAHHFEPSPNPPQPPSDESAGKPIDVPPGGVPARALYIMDRSGRMAGQTRLADGTVIPAPPERGRLVDSLRRCFGLPTAAPELPASELIGRLWLANVLAVGEEQAANLGWKQVRELHPSAEALRAVGVPLTGTTLDRARDVAGTAWTWARLRLQATEGDWLPALIHPELAAWMDEGMFSRWILEETLTTADLLELVTPWVTPSVLTKLARAVST
jgi:hypothetical protein